MAKQSDPNTLDIGAVLAANTSPPNNAVQDALLRYLEKQNRRAEQMEEIESNEREELKRKILQKQLQMADNANKSEQKRLNEEKAQAMCSHQMVSAMGQVKTALAAQRAGMGKFTARCQSCGKQWTAPQEIPPHLYPKPLFIGGPTSY